MARHQRSSHEGFDSPTSICREFWAALIGSSVDDGSVPGFDQYWSKLSEIDRQTHQFAAKLVTKHILKDGQAKAEAFRRAIAWVRRECAVSLGEESPPHWTKLCVHLHAKVHDAKWKPPQVLAALEASKATGRYEDCEDVLNRWIAEMVEFGQEWPVERQGRNYVMADGRTVWSRFA